MVKAAHRQSDYRVINPADSALHLYDLKDRNHCPNCAGLQWYIGRLTAECAHCGTALSLSAISSQPHRPLFSSTKSATAEN